MGVTSYRDLKVWQLGMDLAEDIYKLSSHLPKHELYGLTSQIRRAAVSVSSNIAEGQARQTTKEFLHFISIALGSLAELETQILLANRLHYSQPETTHSLVSKIHELGRMLRTLQNSLRKRLE